MLVDLHMDHEGSSQETIQEVQPEEVLVISLGTGSQLTPGMMSENEVRTSRSISLRATGVEKCRFSSSH